VAERRVHDRGPGTCHGVGWANLDPDADQPEAEIRLNPEQVIQGRLFDLQGRPAQGVVVSVSAIQPVLLVTRETRLCNLAASKVRSTGGLA